MQFSDDVWDAFGAASEEVMDENMGDEMFARHRTASKTSCASSADGCPSLTVLREQRQRVLGNVSLSETIGGRASALARPCSLGKRRQRCKRCSKTGLQRGDTMATKRLRRTARGGMVEVCLGIRA